jgi:hypothetical protein
MLATIHAQSREVGRHTGATSAIKPLVSDTNVGVRRSWAPERISVTLVIKAGVKSPLTEDKSPGSELMSCETSGPPRRSLAVPRRDLVWFVVGALSKVARSVTTSLMFEMPVGESSCSIPESDCAREPKRPVSPVVFIACRSKSSWSERSSMSDRARASSTLSRTLAAGAGFAMSIAGKVNAATTAAGMILKKCMVTVGTVKIESSASIDSSDNRGNGEGIGTA